MATKTISIHKQNVEVSAPYTEGHTINANEARVLNQVRAENIANNFRSKIKDALDGIEGADDLNTVLAALADYDKGYEFTAASSGGGRASLSPVEREARKIARKLVARELAKEGRSAKEVQAADKEAYEAEVVRVSELPQVVKAAKATIKQMEGLTLEE